MVDRYVLERLRKTPLGMSRRHRDFGSLLAALAGFFAGFLTLTRGGANYFGVTEISGTQAQLFGWASIGFSMVIFVICLRGAKRD